jgi:hypothetical protein
MEGLEPPRLSAPDPKSGTATNYATSAGAAKMQIFLISCLWSANIFNRVPGGFYLLGLGNPVRACFLGC